MLNHNLSIKAVSVVRRLISFSTSPINNFIAIMEWEFVAHLYPKSDGLWKIPTIETRIELIIITFNGVSLKDAVNNSAVVEHLQRNTWQRYDCSMMTETVTKMAEYICDTYGLWQWLNADVKVTALIGNTHVIIPNSFATLSQYILEPEIS